MQRIGLALLALLVFVGTGWAWSNYNDQIATATDDSPGINAEPSATPTEDPTVPLTETLPDKPSALFLGDSYTQGAGATTEDRSWAHIAAKKLGWVGTFDGYGGTGFTWDVGADGRTGQDYLSRLQGIAEQTPRPEFDVIVLQGGQNDHRASEAELEAATEKVVKYAEEQWPAARIIVFGPVAPQPLGGLLNRIARPIEAAARSTDASSINPTAEQWLDDENSPRYDFDGSHVNQAGHSYLAGRFVEAVESLQVSA